MTIGAMIGGLALLVAAYAFHWHARLLGARALDWQGASIILRRTLVFTIKERAGLSVFLTWLAELVDHDKVMTARAALAREEACQR